MYTLSKVFLSFKALTTSSTGDNSLTLLRLGVEVGSILLRCHFLKLLVLLATFFCFVIRKYVNLLDGEMMCGKQAGYIEVKKEGDLEVAK